MRYAVRIIVGAVLFGLALLASSYFLKGNAAGDWVDAALYVGLAAFLLSQAFFAIRGPKKHSE
jgi:uncharacterized membrane protein